MPPPRFLESVYDTFPDDNSVKEVWTQAASLTYDTTGDRHVVMWWLNGISDDGVRPVTQLLQLTGQPGNYSYYSPVAKVRGAQSVELNQQFFLGEFSRAQRDRILRLASDVGFERKSTINNCQVWMRGLLEAMLGAGLISTAKFAEIDAGVPLMKRRPEA